MPTYEYECENGHRFEVFQPMKAEPLSECVECGSKVRRLIGPGAGFLFRGGGFYSTDNRSKDYKQKAKAESPKPESPKTESPKTSGESQSDAGGSGKGSKSSGSGKSGDSGSSA